MLHSYQKYRYSVTKIPAKTASYYFLSFNVINSIYLTCGRMNINFFTVVCIIKIYIKDLM
jgi:hypothetical protein